jgi:uncharacterized protein (TIGR04255 family)
LARLPAKLQKEPLVEGLFEFRFAVSRPFAELAPGFLYPRINGQGITNLPAMEIPISIRRSDEKFRYAPLIRIELDRFRVSIGERVLSIACRLPYVGWSTGFREAILHLANSVSELGAIDSVERHSIKYINVLEGSNRVEQTTKLALELEIGGRSRTGDNFQVKSEWVEGEHLHLLHIATDANVIMADGSSRSGVIVDVDTIAQYGATPFGDWLARLERSIDHTRFENKRVFFSCLTGEAIEEMGPTYE